MLLFVDIADMSPFPSVGSQEQTVVEGRALVINLPPIDCYPSPPAVVWYDKEEEAVAAEAARTHVTLRGQLVVLSASLITDDGSEYYAKATNLFTSPPTLSQTYSVRVIGKLLTQFELMTECLY